MEVKKILKAGRKGSHNFINIKKITAYKKKERENDHIILFFNFQLIKKAEVNGTT